MEKENTIMHGRTPASRTKASISFAGMVTALALLLGLAASAGAAPAHKPEQFRLVNFTTSASDTLAGGHPTVSTTVAFASEGVPPTFEAPHNETLGRPRRIEVDLPYGLVGDPTNVARCNLNAFKNSACPVQSMVGVADIELAHYPLWDGSTFTMPGSPIFNLEPGKSAPARFGILIFPGMIYSYVDVKVRPDGGLTAVVDEIANPSPLIRSVLTLWGVPADANPCNPNRPGFDPEAPNPYDPFGAPCPETDPASWEREPFMTAPTDCSTLPESRIRAFSYEGYSDAARSYDPLPTGCESLVFEPSVTAAPTNPAADGVSGLNVDISVPQNDDPDGRATPHLRHAKVVLPEGVSINPGLAHGLEACSDAAFGKGVEGPAACPGASKVGRVSVDTPLLEDPLPGDIYIGQPLAGDRYRLFIYIEGRGVIVKLVGSVRPDPATGQVTTVFGDNPPMPFDNMRLEFQGGSRGILAMPQTCGPKVTTSELGPWTGLAPALPSSAFDVSWDGVGAGCPAALPFEPGFEAGSERARAGDESPFAVSIARPDRHDLVSGVDVDLPSGLLAKIKGVPLCGSADAATGSCPVGSRIGTVNVAAGPGPSPLYLPGTVALTEGYKGAPYGLSIAVPAIAGPYDLGMVVVRQAVHVDPETAEISVSSDPIPQIVEGIPTRLQRIDVDIDRPGFTTTPTSCRPDQVKGTFRSIGGASSQRSVPYRATGCRALRLKPRMTMALTGARQRREDGHPGLRVVIAQPGEQANLEGVTARLPLSLALDPENSASDDLCEYEDGLRADCPRSSIVGRAVAASPLLNRPLTGPVHFVKNVRIDPRTGNRIRTLPTLLVRLRGEIAINLRSRTAVKGGKLVSKFDTIPDAEIDRFTMTLRGGKRGILVVTRADLCRGAHVAKVYTDGHNGRRSDRNVRMKSPCRERSGPASRRR